jgi:hypothetical protein
MKTQAILDPQQWAETTFGQTHLKDMRRTRRAVKAATHLAEESAASRPSQAQTWTDTQAVYRLLTEPDVTFDALMQPHWQQTRKLDGEVASRLAGPGPGGPGFEPSPQDTWLGRNRRWERAWGVPANHPGHRTGQPRGAGVCLSTSLHSPPCSQGGNSRTPAQAREGPRCLAPLRSAQWCLCGIEQVGARGRSWSR